MAKYSSSNIRFLPWL